VARGRYTLPHILGYHGCDAVIGEKVLAGKATLEPSDNEDDWLGNGIYFWVDSPERAWHWANNHPRRQEIRKPFVLGALVYPALCLNLTDYGVMEQLRLAREVLTITYRPEEVPENTLMRDGVTMLRRLDCAVIEAVHRMRKEQNQDPCDSVIGAFEEGKPAFHGAGFRERTHIQLAVRDPDSVVSYFRVDLEELRKSSMRAH